MENSFPCSWLLQTPYSDFTSALNSAEQSWVKHPVKYLEEAKESSSLETEWGNVNAYLPISESCYISTLLF